MRHCHRRKASVTLAVKSGVLHIPAVDLFDGIGTGISSEREAQNEIEPSIILSRGSLRLHMQKIPTAWTGRCAKKRS